MQFSHSFPLWIAAIGVAFAAVIITFAYRRTDKPLSRRLKITLITLRTLSVGLLLICLLEPTLVAREDVQRKASLLVMVDDSQSMSLTDANDTVSRIDSVKEAFARKEKGLMTALADKFNLHFYQFGSDCNSVETLEPGAEGTLTNIGGAISKVASEWRGQFTAGMVLITDGGNNSGENPLEAVQQTGMPVYTVGVGSAEMPRDIQVAKVEVSPLAYVDHILPVRAIIKSSGYDGREVSVSLMQGRELKDSVSLTLDSQYGEHVVDLQFRPKQEGTFNLTVTVPAAPEELTDQNNVYPFFVKVVKTKLKVLYIEGKPRWEHTFLRRALQQDPNIESTLIVDAGSVLKSAQSQFPATSKELFLYDVVIIGDINPGFFSDGQLNMINEFVEDKSGGVIFLGGKRSLGREGFGESSLRGMLPIEIGPGGARQMKGAFSPLLTQDGLRHPVTRLSDDRMENVAIWRDMPVLMQFYQGTGIKLGATILAENQRAPGQPLIAFQRYGQGIVLLVASDSLWRWAFGSYTFGGDDSHYRRFWSGAIRWLASARTQADLVNVQTDKGAYHRDEKVLITAYVYDESYTPLSEAQLKAQVSILDIESPTPDTQQPSSSIRFSADGNGRYSAEFNPARDGHYRLRVEAHHAGGLLGEGTAEFIVQAAILEFQDTQLKEGFLKNIADASGGSYHHFSDVSDLPSSIREVSDTYSFIRERGLWDNSIVLIIAVALLGTEWLLRKRRGLV